MGPVEGGCFVVPSGIGDLYTKTFSDVFVDCMGCVRGAPIGT